MSALINEGYENLLVGNFSNALRMFEDILLKDPTNADALWLKGVVLLQQNNIPNAIATLEQATNQRPTDAAICNDLGMAYDASGDIESARAAFEKALLLDPNLAPALVNIAKVELNEGNTQTALDRVNAAIEKQPDICEAYNIRAAALQHLANNTDALEAYNHALKLDPMNAEVLCNKGLLLHEMGKADAAERSLQQALAQGQYTSSYWANAKMTLGLIQADKGQLQTALAHFDEVLQKHPDHIYSLVNRGDINQRLEDFQQAELDFSAALSIDPNNAEALHNRGLLNLLRGQWAQGWDDMEARWLTQKFDSLPRDHGLKTWDGDVDSKSTLLVWGEQGIGDQILFSQILDDLSGSGMKTILEVDPRLVPLLSRGREPQTVFEYGKVPDDILANCTAQVSIGSLGRFLRRESSSFPDVKPNTLVPNKTKQSELRTRYEALANGRKVVGVAWYSTNPSFGMQKSLPLEQWTPILRSKNVVFVSLQYGEVGPDTVAAKAATGTEIYVDPNVDPMADLDLAAAQIAAMDLVVSISNTATHMAGALGKEAWVIVPKVPEWRWGLKGDQSDWYSQVRIFRQEERGDWTAPVQMVARALSDKFAT